MCTTLARKMKKLSTMITVNCKKIMILIILKINEELCMKAYRQSKAEKQ